MKRTPRALVLAAHLWLSLAVGVVFAVAAGTGAILTFRYEIDAFLNRNAIYPVTAGDVGFEAVEATVRREFPRERLEMIWFPRWDKPYYEAGLRGEGDLWRQVVVDPGTGSVLRPREPASTAMDVVTTIHTSLLGGEVGRWVVVVTTVLSVVILVTGVVLWWPGVRRLARGFVVRRGRTFHVLNRDLHQVAGVLALPFLLAMAVSGVFLAFPDVANRAAHAVVLRGPSSMQDWTAVTSRPRPAGWTEARRPSPAALLRAAHAEVPGAATFYITFPGAPDDPVHVRLQTGADPKPFGVVSRLAFDQYTGELLQVIDPRRMSAPERFVVEWNSRLHFGDFGVVTKALYAVACLMGVGLVVTGFVIWWLKRARKRRSAERRHWGGAPPRLRRSRERVTL